MKISGSLFVIGCLLLAIYVNRPRFLTEHSGKNLTTIEHRAMRYLGVPSLWAILLVFFASTFNQVFGDGISTFLVLVQRLGLGFFALLVGANGLVHGLLIWPPDKVKILRWIAIIPALIFLTLGGMAIVVAYRW